MAGLKTNFDLRNILKQCTKCEDKCEDYLLLVKSLYNAEIKEERVVAKITHEC